MHNLNSLGNTFFQEFLNPAVLILSSGTFVYFLYGVMMFYVAKMKGDQDGLDKGKRHMLWGLVGIFIIYSASSIFEFFYGLFISTK